MALFLELPEGSAIYRSGSSPPSPVLLFPQTIHGYGKAFLAFFEIDHRHGPGLKRVTMGRRIHFIQAYRICPQGVEALKSAQGKVPLLLFFDFEREIIAEGLLPQLRQAICQANRN
jgi:hypothetical protein